MNSNGNSPEANYNNGNGSGVVDHNGSFDIKYAQLNPGANTTSESSITTTSRFIRGIAPYIEGRENTFRTDSFTKLDTSEKTNIYRSINEILLGLSIGNGANSLEWLKGKVELVGEPGISYENGLLKIGPGVSKAEIQDFIKQKSEEEQVVPVVPEVESTPEPEMSLDDAAPVPPEEVPPPAPVHPSVEPEETKQEPQTATEPTPEQPEPFDTDEITPLKEEQKPTETIPENGEKKDSQDSMPEWQKITEWADLERLRRNASFLTVGNKDVVKKTYEENKIGEETEEEFVNRHQQEYQEIKGHLAYKIREILTREALTGSDVLSEEDQQRLNKKINDTVFDELVQKENEAYLAALKENRSETWKDKGKEALKTVAGLKLVSWYLKQNKWTRVAVNTGLFGIAVGAGTFIGGGAALTAMGATAFRGARAAGSVLGSGLGSTIDKKRYKQIEQVNEEERNEVEEIKNNKNLSLEEKTKKYTEAKEKYYKERKWITKRKAMFMVGGGVLAGSATGGLLDMYYGSTGASASDLEDKKGGSVEPRRLSRGTLKPGENVAKTGETMDQTIKAPSSEEVVATKAEIQKQVMEESKQAEVVKPEAKPDVTETKPETPEVPEKPKVAEVPEAPKMSFKPEDLVHEVKAGDSTWSILKNTLETQGQLKLTEAQKTYVLSALTDKVLENPETYKLGSGGSLNIGNKVDFTKLFGDTKEIESIVGKAKQIITEGSDQEKSILDNNLKISNWVKEHPNTALNQDRVAEILSSKPKVFVMPKPEMVEPQLPEEPELERPKISGAEGTEVLKPISPDVPETPPVPKPGPELERVRMRLAQNDTNLQDQAGLTEEVVAAKKRLGILEEGRERLRTMSSDTSEVAKNAEINQAVESAFKNEVNDIYGESSFLGLKKVAGVDTKEWKTIAGLPARRVLEYFKSPETSDLPKTILAELQTSEKHRKLVEHIADLVEEAHKHSNADFKPYDNGENVGDYIKRVGGFLMRQQIEGARTLQRAA